jgi:hypothetical protein
MFNDYSEDYYHFRRSDPNNPPGLSRFYLYRLAMRVLSPSFFHENNSLINHVWKIKNLPETDTERSRNFLASSNKAFKTNIEHMVALLQGMKVEIVLATFAIRNDIYHWTENLPAYLWEVGIRENNEAIIEVAAERDLALVPFADTPFLVGSKRLNAKLFADSIHMGPEGNQLKAEIFADTIAPIVAEALGVATPPPSFYFAEMQAQLASDDTDMPATAGDL